MHALAKSFVTLDNFYDSGDVSRYGHDARDAPFHYFQRSGVWDSDSESISLRFRCVELHDVSYLQRSRIGGRLRALHADDLSAQAEEIADCNRAADAGTQSDWNVQHIEHWRSPEKL
jgi:hypothetical protein